MQRPNIPSLTRLTLLAGLTLALLGCVPPQQTTTAQPTAVADTTASPTAAATTASETTAPENNAEFDRMFIDMMTPHHQSASEMAEIALERAEHPELQEMAQQIIDAQSAEIEQMRTWRQEWYGSSDTPPMSQMPMLPGLPMTMTNMMNMTDTMSMTDTMAMTDTMPMTDTMAMTATTGMTDSMGMMDTMDMTQQIEQLRNAPEPFDLAFIDAMIPHHETAIAAAQLAQEQAIHQEIRDLATQIIEAQQQEIDQLRTWRQEWYPGQ